MIASTKKLEKYCTDYTKIENYQEALKSPLKFDLHHRLEISEMQSASDLIFLHLYYNRPPEELIFIEHGEHKRLHNMNMSTDTRQKMSENNCRYWKGKPGPLLGKPRSEETRQKISEALKGKPLSAETRKKMSNAKKNMSEETKQKMSEAHRGLHWHLENGHRIWTD